MEYYRKYNVKIQLFIFCGDFNLNTLMISPAENSKSNEFQNTFFAYGFNPLIVDLPTSVNKFTETCTLIDNIMYTLITTTIYQTVKVLF